MFPPTFILGEFNARGGAPASPSSHWSGTGPAPSTYHNVQRFSLGGAAHRRRRRSPVTWVRAGEGKTVWTKPHPTPRALWALNPAGSSADTPTEHTGQ